MALRDDVWGPMSVFGRDLTAMREILTTRQAAKPDGAERCRRWRLANPGKDHASRLAAAAKKASRERESH